MDTCVLSIQGRMISSRGPQGEWAWCAGDEQRTQPGWRRVSDGEPARGWGQGVALESRGHSTACRLLFCVRCGAPAGFWAGETWSDTCCKRAVLAPMVIGTAGETIYGLHNNSSSRWWWMRPEQIQAGRWKIAGFGNYILMLGLTGFPEDWTWMQKTERMMIKDDLQGFGLSIRKALGANKWFKEGCGWSRLKGRKIMSSVSLRCLSEIWAGCWIQESGV